MAETVDFESAGYLADKTFADVDGWVKGTDPVPAQAENFKILSVGGNQWAHCLSNSYSVLYRPFTDHGTTVDLRWRWRAGNDSVHFCLGISGNTGGARLANRASACLDPQGWIETQGLANTLSDQIWKVQTWYYMRLVLDQDLNVFSLYIATDSLRTDERIAAASAAMNSVGSLNRVVLRDENGSGAVDIDDISWETQSVWKATNDSLWTAGKNWSAGSQPDSQTHVVFNGTSIKNCFLNKSAVVKSITVASDYKGTLNFGSASLTPLYRADFTGGLYAAASGGQVRFSGAKAASLTGPVGGQVLPAVRHDGPGTLRLANQPLYAMAFTQTQGALDLNGNDLSVQGDLVVSNGSAASLLNLEGRNLSVGKSARFDGVSKDTLLNLISASPTTGTPRGWNIAVNDSLIARFCYLSNSHATLSAGYAFSSSDAGGNSNWIFAAPPGIVVPPKDITVKVGENAVFKVSAASKLPLTFQWKRQDKDIAGQRDSVYTLSGARLSDNGAAFSCLVANQVGSVTSSAANLTVTFPAPTVVPAPQPFADSLTIKLTPSASGAKVFYTMNGGTPQAYAGSLTLKDSTRLSAYAVLGPDTSQSQAWVFPKQPTPQVEAPKFTPDSSHFKDSLLVTLASATAGSVIWYTRDQSDPDSTKLRYTGPIVLRATATLRALATKPNLRPSAIVSRIYTRDGQNKLALPNASPAGGYFSDSVTVRLSPPDSAASASIYYLFGASGLKKYVGPIVLTESGVLKAIAVSGALASDTAAFTFTRRVQAPNAFPTGKNFPDSVAVTLSTKSAGVSILYTLDGLDPNLSPNPKTYAGPIRLDSTAILKAISVLGTDTSAVLSETYNLVPGPPEVSPLGGDYVSKISIQLNCSSHRARIFYTLDGSTPGPENGRPAYSGPIELDTSATLKAVAVAGHGATYARSSLRVENYTFILPGKHTLTGGSRLDLSSNYSLTSPTAGAAPITVEVLKPDSMPNLVGFRDIQFAIRLSLPPGSTAFPRIYLKSPSGEPRALYCFSPPNVVNFISRKDSVGLPSPGMFFLAVDTLPPQISWNGESFVDGDSTKAALTVTDNVSNLILDLERTDQASLGFRGKPIGNPAIVTAVLRNPSGLIAPLGLRIVVDDHTLKTAYPPTAGAWHFVAQRSSVPARSPAVLQVGLSPTNPWDLVSVPLAVEPALTIKQLRKNNSLPALQADLWDAAKGAYRTLGDDEAMAPGSAVWLGAKSSLASLVFPALQTQPRTVETGYTLTLHKGWNLVASPSLSILYWPVSHANTAVYDGSPIKGLHGYDANSESYAYSDSLLPWRGYFVFSTVARDTTIKLLYQPLPASPAPKSAASQTLSLRFFLGRLPELRLGADPRAQDAVGMEDESRPPSQTDQGPSLWSARGANRLETDLLRWSTGSAYSWRIVAGLGNLQATGNLHDTSDCRCLRVAAPSLPNGYAAWAVSTLRGMKFPLTQGGVIPIMPGFTDSLAVYVGPAAELDARLAALPLTVDGFSAAVNAQRGRLSLDLHLPLAGSMQWRLWSLNGKSVAAENLTLPQGIYRMEKSGLALTPGLYVLDLQWIAAGWAGPTAAPAAPATPAAFTGDASQTIPSRRTGRLTLKIAVP